MDTNLAYAEILTHVLQEECKVQFRTIPRLKKIAACDRESGQFLLVLIGRDNQDHWNHSIFFHAQLINGNVIIEVDNSEGISTRLLEAGIRAEHLFSGDQFEYDKNIQLAA